MCFTYAEVTVQLEEPAVGTHDMILIRYCVRSEELSEMSWSDILSGEIAARDQAKAYHLTARHWEDPLSCAMTSAARASGRAKECP